MSLFAPDLRPKPQSKMFNTPMRFDPSKANQSPKFERIKPALEVAPTLSGKSKEEQWVTDMGLDGICDDDGNSNDDDDDDDVGDGGGDGHISMTQYSALRKLLDKETSAKEWALTQSRSYRTKCEMLEEKAEKAVETNRKQLSFLRKTFQQQLKEKDLIIGVIDPDSHDRESDDEGEANKSGGDATAKLQTLASNLNRLVDARAHAERELANESSRATALEEKVGQLESALHVPSGSAMSVVVVDATELKAGREREKELEAKVDEYKTEFATLTEELEALRRKGTAFKAAADAELCKAKQDLDREHAAQHKKEQQAHNTKLRQTLHEKEAEIAALNLQLESSNTQTAQANDAALRSLLYDKEALDVRLKELVAEKEMDHRQMAVLGEKVKETSTELEGAKRDLADALASRNEGASKLTVELDTVKAAHEAKSAAWEQELGQHTQTIAALQEELAGMQTQLKEQKQSVAIDAANVLSDHNDHVASLNAAHAKIAADLKACIAKHLSTEQDLSAKLAEKMQAGENEKLEIQRQAKIVEEKALIVRTDHGQIRKDLQEWKKSLPFTLKALQRDIEKAATKQTAEFEAMKAKLKTEMELRKKYFDQVVDLKGNIRVFCRARPTDTSVVTDDAVDGDVIHVNNGKGVDKKFDFDRYFGPQTSQVEIFDEINPLVVSSVNGYNVCIFAYGQTGAGKTHTMSGTKADPGVMDRALRLVFSDTEQRPGWEYKVECSCLDIYNETCRDLLSEDPKKTMDIKEKTPGVKGGDIVVPGCVWEHVACVEAVAAMQDRAQKNRPTLAHSLNAESSRSHLVLRIRITGVNHEANATTKSKLNLVDLAGSERVAKSGVTGEGLKEAQNINKSLLALGDVISSLSNKDKHVPYRNSKLTWLLSDSLGGNSKCLMFANINPAKTNTGETLCTLNFASRVRSVELGGATKNAGRGSEEVVAKLKARILELEGLSEGHTTTKQQRQRNHQRRITQPALSLSALKFSPTSLPKFESP